MTLEVAINHEFDGDPKQGDGSWWRYNMSFSNISAEPEQLADDIARGHGFCAQHDHRQIPVPLEDGSVRYTTFRVRDNFLRTQVLGLDFDTEDCRSSFDGLMQNPLVETHAGLLYTTKSHTTEKPRSRVVFFLERPATNPDKYVELARAMNWYFKISDQVTHDPVRNWGGSKMCEQWLFPEKVLTANSVMPILRAFRQHNDALDRERKKRFRRPNLDNDNDAASVVDALNSIPSSSALLPYGDWVKVLAALYSVFGGEGISVAQSWTESRQNELETMWRSFAHGTRCTKGTIFALAKTHGWVSPWAESHHEKMATNYMRRMAV